jgi:hypothetical protein
MEYKENYLLTKNIIVEYRNMLCENPHIWLEVVKTLNPAILLPKPISHLDVEYFMDGSSFVWCSTHFAGYLQ